ncbi:UNVERIFIED_CONTAM: hypothetical protein Slati_3107000 [Sesamum latifolium]|uniref:DUF4283 domain-containing protein n=1 Tax=Sesamum latifolium TaxID=2727402 RepID=A0AAW2UXM7_9LAMI
MAKTKRNKQVVEPASCRTKPSGQPNDAPIPDKVPATAGLPVSGKVIATTSLPIKTAAQPSNAPLSVKETAKPTDITKVGSPYFHGFISDLEVSPFAAKNDASTILTSNVSGPRSEEALPDMVGKKEVAAAKKTSFARLLSYNRRLTDDNKLMKFTVEDKTLKLGTNDLIDIHTKLGFCLVSYIVGKFPGLKAIRALSQSWGAFFQQHDSGWLIFRFAHDEDRQRILAGGQILSMDVFSYTKTCRNVFSSRRTISALLLFGPSFHHFHSNVGIRMHLARSDRDWAHPFPWIH